MTGIHITSNNFEIIAMFREFISRNSITLVHSKTTETTAVTKIIHVDMLGFYISSESRSTPIKGLTPFTVNDHKAQFLFSAKYNISTGQRGYYCHYFFLPNKILTIQRRRQPRLYLDISHDFFCHGRFKSGNNFCFNIKNISNGGCALVFEKNSHKENLNNTILRAATLDFGTLGKITIDLEIINQYLVPETNLIQLSCKFKTREESKISEIDRIITRIIIYNKKKHILN
ncbi:hypothetical protein ACXDTG_002474 [Klebsiella pneumoniae]